MGLETTEMGGCSWARCEFVIYNYIASDCRSFGEVFLHSAVLCDFYIVHAGGGFGGKETRSTFLSSAVAVAAHKLVPQSAVVA